MPAQGAVPGTRYADANTGATAHVPQGVVPGTKCHRYDRPRARSEVVQGLRRAGPLPVRAGRGRRVRDRSGLCRGVPSDTDRRGARHAALGASMAAAVIAGAADGGCDVLDVGMVGTEMLYFAVGELGLDGGIAVTASHNPKQYTGMKIVRAGALPVGGESGLIEIRDRARAATGIQRRCQAPCRTKTSGTGSSPRCCRSSTSRPSDRFASSSTPRTGWRARCCHRCSNAYRCSTSSAATSSPTDPSRTTSRTRFSRRTGHSSLKRPCPSARTSASHSTVTPIAASSSTRRVSLCRGTSPPHSSRSRSLPANRAAR